MAVSREPSAKGAYRGFTAIWCGLTRREESADPPSSVQPVKLICVFSDESAECNTTSRACPHIVLAHQRSELKAVLRRSVDGARKYPTPLQDIGTTHYEGKPLNPKPLIRTTQLEETYRGVLICDCDLLDSNHVLLVRLWRFNCERAFVWVEIDTHIWHELSEILFVLLVEDQKIHNPRQI